MSVLLPIALLVFATFSTLSAFGGETWTKGSEPLRKRITTRGWVSLLCLSCTLVLGIVKEITTASVASTKASQLANARQQVQKTAHTEVREALQNILHPFEILLENAEYGPAKLPYRGPADFYCSPDYMESCMKAPEFVNVWSQYKMKSNPEYPDVDKEWWLFFSENAKRNSSLLDSIVQKYGTFLEPGTLSAVHDLQTDDFFRLKLVMLDELIRMNDDMLISHAFRSPREYADYEVFVTKAATLMRRVADGNSRWCDDKPEAEQNGGGQPATRTKSK